jgi:chloramphenicol 3-O phosphotransferase
MSRPLGNDRPAGPTGLSAGCPQVVFVNGASSAGKTSLIKAMQQIAPVPYLHVGLDHCFATVPEPWAGGGQGRFQAKGFAYQQFGPGRDGLPRAGISYGPDGAAIMSAYRRSLVTLIERGCRLAVDEMLLDADIGADYVRLFQPFDVQYVLMTAAPDCLEARCVARNYQPGFGRWSMKAGDHLPRAYDVEFGSQSRSSAECAAELVLGWSARRR